MNNPELQVTPSQNIKINKNSLVYLHTNTAWVKASQDWIVDFNKNKKSPTYLVLYRKVGKRHYFAPYHFNDVITEVRNG